MADSKFSALKGLRDKPQLVKPQAVQPEPVEEQSIAPERPQEAAAGQGGPAKRGPGRPEGKRSNPDYERMNLLVRKATRRKVDMKMLLEPGAAIDLSELVDRLLDQWAG